LAPDPPGPTAGPTTPTTPPGAPAPAVDEGGSGLLPLLVLGAVTVPLRWNPEINRKHMKFNERGKLGHGHTKEEVSTLIFSLVGLIESRFR